MLFMGAVAPWSVAGNYCHRGKGLYGTNYVSPSNKCESIFASLSAYFYIAQWRPTWTTQRMKARLQVDAPSRARVKQAVAVSEITRIAIVRLTHYAHLLLCDSPSHDSVDVGFDGVIRGRSFLLNLSMGWSKHHWYDTIPCFVLLYSHESHYHIDIFRTFDLSCSTLRLQVIYCDLRSTNGMEL